MERFLPPHPSLGCNPQGEAAGGPAWWDSAALSVAEPLQCPAELSPARGHPHTGSEQPPAPFTAPNSPPSSWAPLLGILPAAGSGGSPSRPSELHVLRSAALPRSLPSPQDLPSPCPHPSPSDILQLPPLCPGLEKKRKEHPELPAAALPSASGQAQPHRPGHVRAQQGLGPDLFPPKLASLFTFSQPFLHHSAPACRKPTPSALRSSDPFHPLVLFFSPMCCWQKQNEIPVYSLAISTPILLLPPALAKQKL